MSIIYDALKKVEQSNLGNSGAKIDTKKIGPRTKPKIYLFYILAVFFGLLIGNAFFNFLTRAKTRDTASLNKEQAQPQIIQNTITSFRQASPEEVKALVFQSQQPLSQEAPATLPSVTENKPRVPLTLNGVFFSGNEGYALINNQIVKVGDAIEGATVKQISLGEVELEVNGSIIKLSTAGR